MGGGPKGKLHVIMSSQF